MNTAAPLLEIQGGRGGLSPASLRELWVFREVLWAFTLRQVKVKYKQAVVGVGWAVIQPLASAALFALFLGRLARVPSEGVPYLLFALTGMVAWTYFSSAAGSASESLVADQSVLRKVYFPREVLPMASVAAALLDLTAAFGVLILASLAAGMVPTLAWLLIGLPLLVLIVSAAAFGIGLAALNVYFRDVRYALPFVMQLALFVTPVVYPLSIIPRTWRTAYAILDPPAAAIDGLRRIILHHAMPDIALTLAALTWALLALALAYLIFKRLERGFSDRL